MYVQRQGNTLRVAVTAGVVMIMDRSALQ